MLRALPWIVSLALVLQLGVACSGGGDGSEPAVAGGSGAGSGGAGGSGAGAGGEGGGEEELGELDPELTAAVADGVEAFGALSEDDQLTTLSELDRQVERELWRLGEIDDELGEASADDAYADSLQGLTNYYASVLEADLTLEAEPQPYKIARKNVIPEIGGALFSGLLINKLVSGSLIPDTNAGKAGSKAASDTVSITGARDRVATKFDFSEPGSEGVTTKLSGVTELVVCPDASGSVSGKLTLDMSATVAGGNTGEKGTLTVNYVATVDDDAERVGMDITSRLQLARFRDQKGEFVDLSMRIGIGTGARESEVRANRSGGQVTDAFVQNSAKLGTFFSTTLAVALADEVSNGWKSGRCVEVQTTPGGGSVGPSDSVGIQARPRSRLDGTATGGTVMATLDGETSLDPQGKKVAADATFTYVAPGEAGQSATVSLEAKSKRGVGKTSLTFTTGTGWVASGGGDMITITGEVASLTEPFTLNGTFPGGTAVFDYTPADAESGTFVSALSGSGVTGSTEGTYTITGEEGGPLTLEQTGYGCVDGIPDSCRSQTEVITLTPK